MIERDPNIVKSGLSRTVKTDGVTVEVSIIRLEGETQWSLEVVDSANTSIVWDELFATDEDAYAEFERTVADRVPQKGTAATEIERCKGVDASLLYRWRRQFAAERPVRFRCINHFYTFRFHAYQLTKRRPQELSVLRVRLEQHHIFLASKMKQMEGHPSAYVAELRQGDWRVVVPIRGKLSPRIAQRSFSNRTEACAWLQSEVAMHSVSELRMGVTRCG